jgi:hypothetical protein
MTLREELHRRSWTRCPKAHSKMRGACWSTFRYGPLNHRVSLNGCAKYSGSRWNGCGVQCSRVGLAAVEVAGSSMPVAMGHSGHSRIQGDTGVNETHHFNKGSELAVTERLRVAETARPSTIPMRQRIEGTDASE